MNSRTKEPKALWVGLLLSYGLFQQLGYAESQLLPGETLPILQNVQTDVSVHISTDDIFTYTYAILNPVSNTGRIERIEVDISKELSSVPIGIGGISSDVSFAPADSATFQENAGRFIFVGFRSPAGWDSGFSRALTASWGASDPHGDGSFLIRPGKSLQGFILQSRGLPGMRTIIFHPEFIQTPVEEADEASVTRVRSIEQQIKFNSTTIGPNAPKSFAPISLIDRLISLKHQSVSLGWIFGPGSDGIANSLDAKLDAAKDSVARGNNTAAKNQLNAFINDLDAQRGKHVNDNAYFLLKTNAQFIISKL
jgi:hypothetical protein